MQSKIWDEFLESQTTQLGHTTVAKWLKPLRVVRFDACNLYLEAKDSFQIHWFEEHIRPIVLTKLLSKSNKRVKVHLSLAASSMKSAPSLPRPQKRETSFELQFDSLNPEATFDTFISTEENRVPLALLKELREKKLSLASFNPIYFYGPSGCGKTHLLQALSSHFKSEKLNALYVSAETFTDHVVNAIRTSEMQKFRQAYRSVDVLLVDNVEVFSKKSATQEELFHTFNTLHLSGTQLILAAASTPQELQDVEPRLVSRFEWGIVLPILPLKEEALKLLFLQRLKRLDLLLQERAAVFLLATFREAKGLVKALEALALRLHVRQTSGRPISLPLSLEDVQELLFDLIKIESQSVLTPAKIVHSVAEYHGIRVEDILGKAQSRECSLPRKIAMYLCRSELALPYVKIADFFKRDHSTVMTSVRLVEKQKNEQSEFAKTIHILTKQLKK